MAFLPAGFPRPDDYLQAALDFLGRYEWLYNWPVTEILSSGVLDRLPLEWWRPLRRLTVQELNMLPRGLVPDHWPGSLRDLVRGCAALRLPAADSELGAGPALRPALKHALRKGLTPKKLHEVTHLAALVHDVCQRAGVKCVVDMGSGHGYLCEVLHHEYGYRVLGLEAVPARVQEARQRHHDTCRALRVPEDQRGGVQYLECDVSADSPGPIVSALSSQLDEDGQPAPFCLVGLHSCGDLTPSAITLFRQIDQLRAMALVSCCYHLMKRVELESLLGAEEVEVTPGRPEERDDKLRLVLQWAAAGAEARPEVQAELARWMESLLRTSSRARPELFHNFPLSPQLRGAAAARSCPTSLYLRRPMLRLAAQETLERWEVLSSKSHRNHSVHVMARAVFHLYTTSRKLRVEKRTRRCARRGQAECSPEAVLGDMVERMLPIDSPGEAAAHKQGLAAVLVALDPLRPLLEALTGLQMALQSVAEGLVLVDRLLALSDQGAGPHARIVRVADQVFTPRCFALVATK